jgi:hypothetical protein
LAAAAAVALPDGAERPAGAQIEGEFPQLLPIRESLIKYVFEPNAARKAEVQAAVRSMRGRV